MDELRAIVQRMVETGRSEEEISTVVQNYQKEKSFTKNDFIDSTKSTAPSGFEIEEMEEKKVGYGYDLLKSFSATGISILDNVIDIAEFAAKADAKLKGKDVIDNAIIEAARKKDSKLTKEDYDKLNRFNVVDLEPIAQSIRKSLPNYTNDKGEKLDFVGLINEGRYPEAAESFGIETAGALPSLLVSMVPGGYFALGASSGLEKYSKDIIERKDENVANIVANSIIFGGADAVGEYIGGKNLRRLFQPLKNTGKKVSKDVKDSVIGGIGNVIKKGWKGGRTEFMQEAITSVIQDVGDAGLYGDEKTLAQVGRNALHSGLIGFALGGGTGTIASGMDSKNRTKFYEYLATHSYKVDQMELSQAQEKAEQDLKNAPKSKKKKFQKVVDDIKAKKQKLQDQVFEHFEDMRQNDPKALELMIEKINEQHSALDIINGGDKYSNEAKEQAKKDFKEAADIVGDLFAVTDTNYDSEIELELSNYIRAAEEIDEVNKGLWFKSKDLKYDYAKTQEQYDALKKEYKEKGINIDSEANGFFTVTEDGKKRIFINQDVAASAKATNVIGHELLHYALSNRFANDPKYLRDSVIAFNQYLDSLPEGKGKYIRKSIEKRLANPKNGYAKLDANGKVQKDSDGLIVMNEDSYIEEYFTMFTDLIKNEKIDVVEDASKGLANTLRTTIRGLGLGFNNVDFKNGQEVFDFLIDYNKNLGRKGILGAITQRKAIQQAAGKDVKKAKPVQLKSKSNLQNMLDTDYAGNVKKMGVDAVSVDSKGQRLTVPDLTKSKLGKDIAPMVENITKRLYDPILEPGELTRGEYKNALVGIASEIIRTENFDPTKQSLDKFVSSRLYLRSNKLASDLGVPQQFTKDIENIKEPVVEEVTTETKEKPQLKKIVLADRLGITKQVAEAINKIVPNLDINKLTFKTLKNEIPEITSKLFGISTKKIENLANLTKSELQSAQMFINKNADLLIAMLPEGATAGGTATGVPNSLLKAFYTKTSRAKMAKTGTKAGLAIQQKNNIKKTDFLETFGIIDGKPDRTDRNTSARVLALANLTGKMITNQAVRQELGQKDVKVVEAVNKIKDGKSNIMFSKSYGNEVLKKLKLSEVSNQNVNDRVIYKGFVEEILPKFVAIPRLKGGKFRLPSDTYGPRSTITPGYYMTASQRIISAVKAGNVQLRNKVYTKEQIEQTNKAYSVVKFDESQKQIDTRRKGAELFINGLNEAVNSKKGNKQNLRPIQMLLGSTPNGTYHIVRMIAPGLGITNVGRASKREHVLVANNAADIIIESLAKDNISLVLPWLLDNYYQINLNAQQDALVDNAYEGSKTEMPSIFYENLNKAIDAKDMSLASDPIIRYTIANVNLSEINWHTGGTLLQHIDNKYGFGGALSYGNNSETSVQEVNRILTEFFAKRADKKTTKKAIENIASVKFSKTINSNKKLNNAISFSRSAKNPTKGITILDFDDTLATTKSLVKFTAPDGTTGTLNAEQFASTYQDLQDQGYTFDFSDFNKVVKGKLAPLFNKAIKLQGKFGPENMFVLTARPPASQKAIFDFLKANGLNIPLKNITGLGNSTSEAKALWVADKVAEGYNDFYFADDALQNVQAVKNMLDQFDVKSKVQQAKVKFSKSMDKDFNKILQDVTGIEFKKRFSDIKARKRGASKGKFRFFVPPSHEDFVGLLYNFMGKGRKGDQHRDFFEKALVRPLNRAYREIDTAKQAIANDYKALNKQFDDIKKKLRKKTPDGDFIFEDAIRVYLWNKHGYEIPGLSPTDQKNLVELVNNDAELKAYADAINIISKQDAYVDPGKGWEGGNIKTDLIDATGRVGREQYFAEFKENADVIFSLENLNKIEAAYGKDFRSALEDILHRISTGINRPKGQHATVNAFMNYLNGSVGTVMFFNVRSAILQQMSIVNYINFADNNIFAAAKAFANQKQYWKDFAFIFNSDMLKQRRGGIGTDINGADLAQAVQGSKDPTKVVISRLLQLGFLPTQIGDNIAIATGGATFYRNRINKYIKDGLSQKEAEAKAFTDFQDITQSTQQSSRPDMTSQQQASWIGKLVLNFQNITSQYNRIIKKAALDIKNGRISPPYTTKTQSNLGNLSKILYYGGIQNVIFYSLQTALFAVMFDDDDDEDQVLKKSERVINGSIDSILRGSGIYGAVASTLKNAIIKWKEQREPNYNKDESGVLMELLNFSPVVGIKSRMIVNAEKTLNYNENIISEMETFEAENPMWSAATNYTQALTNFPANRLYQKTLNMRNALDKDYTNFQRVMFFSGYTTWSLGLGDSEAIINAKEKVKINKKNSKKKKPKKGFKGFTVPQNVW